MLGTATHRLLHARPLLTRSLRPSNYISRSSFSVLAIHSSFPATLYRYNSRQKSSLFDVKDIEQRDDDPRSDAVEVSRDGLVYPGLAQNRASSGAWLGPNTFSVQQLFRLDFDYYVEAEEEGRKVDEPLIFSIPKGTPVRNGLVLFHEYVDHFSLQPSRGMPLDEFNQILDDFYSLYAQKMIAEQWIHDHPYQEAIVGSAYSKWMSQ